MRHRNASVLVTGWGSQSAPAWNRNIATGCSMFAFGASLWHGNCLPFACALVLGVRERGGESV